MTILRAPAADITPRCDMRGFNQRLGAAFKQKEIY